MIASNFHGTSSRYATWASRDPYAAWRRRNGRSLSRHGHAAGSHGRHQDSSATPFKRRRPQTAVCARGKDDFQTARDLGFELKWITEGGAQSTQSLSTPRGGVRAA